MVFAVERVIHQPSGHVQVLAQRFLVVKLLVVAALQPLVKIRCLGQQKPVFKRFRLDHVVTRLRLGNESPVHPVVSLRRPHRESAQSFGLRIAQPAFQSQPRRLRRICQLVQAKPRQVRPSQSLEFVQRAEKDPRPAVLHLQDVLRLAVLVRNPVAVQYLEQRLLCRVPQHRVRRRPNQPGPSRIQIREPDCFMTQRLALSRSDRSGKALHARRRFVKRLLGRKRAIGYLPEDFVSS